MVQYLVELYVSRGESAAVHAGVTRALVAAAELTGEGTPVRYVRSIFVPEDETCFVLFEAESAHAVREAARRAEIVFERIAVAVTEPTREGSLRCH